MRTLVVKAKPLENIPLRDKDGVIHVEEFTLASARDFAKDFAKLNACQDTTVIAIVISSYGGNVSALLTMLDVMSTATKPISTIATGAAMSCGSVLLAAGTKGYRFAGPLTEIMIHEISSGFRGPNTSIQSDVKQLGKLNKLFISLLAKYTGKTSKFFTDQLKKSGNVDWYLTSAQAKSIGLIDYAEMPVLLEVA